MLTVFPKPYLHRTNNDVTSIVLESNIIGTKLITMGIFHSIMVLSKSEDLSSKDAKPSPRTASTKPHQESRVLEPIQYCNTNGKDNIEQLQCKLPLPSELVFVLTSFQVQPKTLITLDRLPFDIISSIFEISGVCGSVCIGLTCIRLYAYLKIRFPKPIPLYQTICEQGSKCSSLGPSQLDRYKHHNHRSTELIQLLKTWAGPQYRAVEISLWEDEWEDITNTSLQIFHYFRPVSVFGDGEQWNVPLSPEMILNNRYRDCARIWGNQPRGLILSERLKLPWPSHMGMGWDDATFAYIVRAIPLFASSDAWWNHFQYLDICQRKEKDFQEAMTNHTLSTKPLHMEVNGLQ
jgi:hypothetical protein